MKKIMIIMIVMAGLVSCYTPGKLPDTIRNQALDEMERFRRSFLEGRVCDAELSLVNAIDIFAQLDDICSISDAYIQKYLFFSYVKKADETLLTKADEFASVGKCAEEKKTIEELRRLNAGGSSPSKPGKSPNEIYHSVMLRKAAEVQKDIKYVEGALEIDRNNGWTYFIILDLNILKDLTEDEVEKERLQKRIEFLSGYVQECK